jgi:large-conductance mechanosensitive channel
MMKPDRKQLRQFGIMLALVITLLWWLFAGLQQWRWLAGVVAAVILLALMWPAALGPVHALLMKVGHYVSKVVNPVLLGFVYFVIITPMAWVMRLRGHDPMRRNFDPGVESYREPSDDQAAHRFDRPF